MKAEFRESEPGKGSVFTDNLPAKVTDRVAKANAAEKTTILPAIPWRRNRTWITILGDR